MKMRCALLFLTCYLLLTPMAWAASADHSAAVPGAATSDAIDPETAHELATEAAHGAGAEHHEGGGGLPQFDPSSFTSQIFWLVIAFGVLYVVFSKKTLPEIGGVLKKREVHVRSTLEAAKRQKETAEALQKEYERDIETARTEAMNVFTDIEASIKKNADAQYKAFQQRAVDETKATENAISKAKADAMEDMQALAAEIASKAAEKIIGVETDIDQAKNVVRSLKAKAA